MPLNYHKYFLVISIILLFSGFEAAGQSKTWTTTEKYSNKSREYLKEKVFLHTDRDLYLCGELLWFKAYLTNAFNNKPLSLSKVLYVEVMNTSNQAVIQSKIAMDSGIGNGSLLLPLSIPSGNYIIRAYSNWMKNFSPHEFFKKNISIVNTSESPKISALPGVPDYTVDFFPEGGNMVIGIQSVIAFKVTDKNYKGADSEGIVIDQFNDTVACYKSLRFGMGHFSLIPEPGKEYTAIVMLNNGDTIRKKLPNAILKGYVMHVNDTNLNDLKISVTTNILQSQRSPEVFVLFQNNRVLNAAMSQRLKNGEATFLIHKDSLKDGITRITIFDGDKKPVGERLIFKTPKSKMFIETKPDLENYKPRSNVHVEVVTSDIGGMALPGNLSASVFRLDDLPQIDQESILSYLWLSSELIGNIENPAYYFKNDNAITREALNNLLLTHGWRKFSDEEISKSKTPMFEYIPEFIGHIITGRITNKLTGNPAADVAVYLSVPGSPGKLRTCISDITGSIHFEMKDYFGKNQIVIQTKSEDPDIYNIEIFSPYSEKASNNSIPALSVHESRKNELHSANFHLAVQNYYHQHQLEKIAEPVLDTLPFYYKADKTYYLDNYKRFTTMEEVMREYVLEVNVIKKGAQFRFATLNMPGFILRDLQPTQTIFDKNPLVLLDGVPVFDINKIIAYDPLKVKKLEVVAQKYNLGTLTAEGILSYTTYSENLDGYQLNPNDLLLDYEGLQMQRIFYSPQYATQSELLSRMPDFRKLLFWTPALVTNISGKGNFSFYTGDIPGKYLIVVQGLSQNGYSGSSSVIFNVVK